MADEFAITPELLREYINECREILDGVDAGLLVLESQPDRADTVNDVMRGFHSVKGSSGFLRQTKMQTLSHAAEDVVSAARDGDSVLTPGHIDVLLSALDCLRTMIDEIESGVEEPTTDIDKLVAKLHQLPASSESQSELASSKEPQSVALGRDAVEAYATDAEETLQQADVLLMQLERTPGDVSALQEVIQHFASLQESSHFLGLARIAKLANTAKDMLALSRDRGAGPTPDHLDALLVAVDYLRNLIGPLVQLGKEPEIDTGGVIAMLRAAGGRTLLQESPTPASSQSMPVSEDLLRDYITETREILGQLEASLLVLEGGNGDEDAINDAFRGFHSIKGTSSFLRLEKTIALSHAAEELLSQVRDKRLNLASDHIDALLVSLDYLRDLTAEIERGSIDPDVDIDGIVDMLRAMAAGAPSGVAHPRASSKAEPTPAVVLATKPEDSQAAESVGETRPGAVIDQEATVRIDVRRLDAMLTLVGELLLARNRLNRTAGHVVRALPDQGLGDLLTNDASYVSSLSEDLEAAMLRTRMLPVGRAFSRLPRIVRDAARATGKEVTLEVSGEDTELDRALIEEIGDPLMHLVRNAVDHGLESPEERERAGKPRTGRLSLTAYHEGNRVVIAIQDDGGGIDATRVRNRAVERGIMPADTQLTERETLDLIFQPGFSTRDSADNLSGRGVGLDVVRTNIQRLNGLIEVDTNPGHGTTFLMKIPLTLAVVHVLVVGIRDEMYAVPTSAILEATRLDDEQITMVEGRPFTMYGDEMLPLTYLGSFLGHGSEERPERPYMLMLASAERRAGLLVDRLTGQHEVIVKSLGRGLDESEGVGGAAVLDDGRVSIVLDVGAIVAKVAADQVGTLSVESPA